MSSAFVFAIRIVRSLFYLNSKLQASSHLLLLYSPVCVGPGWKPRKPVFSQRGSFAIRLVYDETFVINGTGKTEDDTLIANCYICVFFFRVFSLISSFLSILQSESLENGTCHLRVIKDEDRDIFHFLLSGST